MIIARRILIGVLLLWLIGFCAYVIRIHFTPFPPSVRPDAVVVLTGGNNRIEESLHVLNKFGCKTLFISGVNRNVTRYDILNRIQKNKDANDSQVDLGYKSRNTHENAQEVISWLEKNKFNRIVLVTAYYHLPRSILEFQAIAPHLQIEPYAVFPVTDTETKMNFLQTTWLFLKEYHKYLFAFIRVSLIKVSLV